MYKARYTRNLFYKTGVNPIIKYATIFFSKIKRIEKTTLNTIQKCMTWIKET
jgi:hypothetical protein